MTYDKKEKNRDWHQWGFRNNVNHPETIADLVNHQTMKIMDALGIENESDGRWKGEE